MPLTVRFMSAQFNFTFNTFSLNSFSLFSILLLFYFNLIFKRIFPCQGRKCLSHLMAIDFGRSKPYRLYSLSTAEHPHQGGGEPSEIQVPGASQNLTLLAGLSKDSKCYLSAMLTLCAHRQYSKSFFFFFPFNGYINSVNSLKQDF